MPMTYLEFHLLFNLPLLALLGWLARRRITAAHWRWMGVIALIVVAFTFPWDNWAVGRGIWQFPEDRVLARVDHLPVEEIAFFIIEMVAVCLVAVHFLPNARTASPDAERPPEQRPASQASAGNTQGTA
jgi:lycopene cyclase domain-containing protein